MSELGLILTILYELFKLWNKSNLEKFENEWKKDRKEVRRIIKGGNAYALNLLIAKYRDMSKT